MSCSLVATMPTPSPSILLNSIGPERSMPTAFVSITLACARSTQTALEIQGQTDVRVFNNTFYSRTGDLIRIEGGSNEVEVQNNILWSGAGFDLYIANNSQSGFFSDYK